MKLYVGNLPFSLREDDLRNAFQDFGNVDSVKIIQDRETNRPRGFGFVEMSDDDEARAAIDGLNGKDFAGRALVVNEARPRPEGGRGGGHRGGRR